MQVSHKIVFVIARAVYEVESGSREVSNARGGVIKNYSRSHEKINTELF